MRRLGGLATCVALEVLCAGALAFAIWFGAQRGASELAETIGWAEAADGPVAAVEDFETEAGALGDVESVGVFDGVSDEVLLEPLRTGRIESIKFNRGGSSISLRIDFDNGARAAFKPRQTNLHSVPRYEVAAFRVNRLLGLTAVAPAIGRRFPLAELMSKLRRDSRFFAERMSEEIVAVRGQVIGELSWWIPVIEPARINRFLIDSVDGVLTWSRYLRVGVKIPQASRNLVAQISDMVLFDFLIDNADRFSGRNVWVSGDRRVLYFMDNTLSFGGGNNGSFKSRAYLAKVQKFSRSLVSRLRELSAEKLAAAVGHDVAPFDFILSEREITTLLGRRDFIVATIDALIRKHGVDKVLVFP